MNPVRIGILAILTILIMGNTLLVPLTYLDYQLRKDYFERVLCEQKQAPITVCGGKCALSKNLDSAQEQSGENQDQIVNNVNPFVLTTIADTQGPECVLHIRKYQNSRQDRIPDYCGSSPFHPPRTFII